ncbi:MAG: tyrosine-type recombinase/integrase [Eubacterium sp.]|nr:tyrosine-type recombinase/integrase [Eubacterium sp.]
MSKTKYEYRTTFYDSNGKRHDIKAHTYHELIEKTAHAKENAEKGIHVDSTLTVEKWASVAFSQYKHCNETTLRNAVWRFNKWVGADLGRRKLNSIKPIDIQRVLNTAEQCGLSAYTLKQIYELARFVFATAEENGLVVKSPVRGIVLPKGKPEKSRRALTPEEDKYFFMAIEQNPKPQYVFFLVMRCCGLRNSECADLRGTDVVQIQGETFLHIQGTKTAFSRRSVPCPTYLLKYLPKPSNPFSYLFVNGNGAQFGKQNQRRAWASLMHDMQVLAGCRTFNNQLIPPYPLATDLTSYDLRHSYATDLARDKVAPITAKTLMGHRDLEMLSRVYTHVDDSMLVEEAKRMNQKYLNAEEKGGKLIKIGENVETCVERNA